MCFIIIYEYLYILMVMDINFNYLGFVALFFVTCLLCYLLLLLRYLLHLYFVWGEYHININIIIMGICGCFSFMLLYVACSFAQGFAQLYQIRIHSIAVLSILFSNSNKNINIQFTICPPIKTKNIFI